MSTLAAAHVGVHTQIKPRIRTCARCGNTRMGNGRPANALCQDCISVTTDLGEREAWEHTNRRKTR